MCVCALRIVNCEFIWGDVDTDDESPTRSVCVVLLLRDTPASVRPTDLLSLFGCVRLVCVCRVVCE